MRRIIRSIEGMYEEYLRRFREGDKNVLMDNKGHLLVLNDKDEVILEMFKPKN